MAKRKFESDAPTWDEIRKLRQPRTAPVWVTLDSALMSRIEDLEQEIGVEERKDERLHRRAVAPRLRKERDRLLDEAADAAVAFTLTEIPRRVYRALIDAHPPTDADKARGMNRWNEETFAPALIAACCVSPELTTVPRGDYIDLVGARSTAAKLREVIEPAVEIWDEWASSTGYSLFAGAYELQEGGSQVPFSVRSSTATHGSEPSSTTAPPEE